MTVGYEIDAIDMARSAGKAAGRSIGTSRVDVVV
jgi:hypothetical protein